MNAERGDSRQKKSYSRDCKDVFSSELINRIIKLFLPVRVLVVYLPVKMKFNLKYYKL